LVCLASDFCLFGIPRLSHEKAYRYFFVDSCGFSGKMPQSFFLFFLFLRGRFLPPRPLCDAPTPAAVFRGGRLAVADTIRPSPAATTTAVAPSIFCSFVAFPPIPLDEWMS
jgi:hypothetical protein